MRGDGMKGYRDGKGGKRGWGGRGLKGGIMGWFLISGVYALLKQVIPISRVWDDRRTEGLEFGSSCTTLGLHHLSWHTAARSKRHDIA